MANATDAKQGESFAVLFVTFVPPWISKLLLAVFLMYSVWFFTSPWRSGSGYHYRGWGEWIFWTQPIVASPSLPIEIRALSTKIDRIVLVAEIWVLLMLVPRAVGVIRRFSR